MYQLTSCDSDIAKAASHTDVSHRVGIHLHCVIELPHSLPTRHSQLCTLYWRLDRVSVCQEVPDAVAFCYRAIILLLLLSLPSLGLFGCLTQCV